MKNFVVGLRLKVPQKEIYYISWNLDACEGAGLLRTDDAEAGKVTVLAPASQLDTVLSFIEGHRLEGIEIDFENFEEIREIMNEQR